MADKGPTTTAQSSSTNQPVTTPPTPAAVPLEVDTVRLRGGKDRKSSKKHHRRTKDKPSSSDSTGSSGDESSSSSSSLSTSEKKDSSSSSSSSKRKQHSPNGSATPSPKSSSEGVPNGAPKKSSKEGSATEEKEAKDNTKQELSKEELRQKAENAISRPLGLESPDKMDFRHYYTYLDQRLSKEANPMSYLPIIEDVLRDLLADKLGNEEHIRYLLRSAIPKFIPTLLSRPDLVPKRTRLTELFCLVLKVIVRFMNDDIKELHGLLAKLFNPNNYSKTKEKERDYQELLQKFLLPEKIADPKQLCAQLVYNKSNDLDLSIHYVLLINYFEECGGFEAIKNRLGSSVNLALLRYLVRPIFNAKDAFTQHFLDLYINEFTELVFARLLEATNTDLNKDEKDLSLIHI
eukprot:TRINITY_DN5080_c0_g1_i3.p1 TRINITY_DN5080_c0_g1~~TRINITY_DN5080_c0_g1_i3.p1  ORF type:complete len:405 (-),score=100.85 TRINITY_DN5080_c0_g1_i3:47-1261(-)